MIRKKPFIFCLYFLSMGFAQSFDNFDVYGGISSVTVSTSDFTNFHISDHESYGLGAIEGRVAVPLGDNDIAGQNMSILLGATSPISSRIDALLEVQVGFGDVSYGAAFTGLNLKLINGNKFRLGFTPKVGVVSSLANFGVIEVLPDKTPPVILPEGTFNEGDSLSMDISGIGINLGMTPSFFLTETLGLTAFVGYQISLTDEPIIKAGDVEIPMDAAGVVKTDMSATQAGISPEANVSGITFQVGIVYNIKL